MTTERSPVYQLDISPYFKKYNAAQIEKVFGIQNTLIIEGSADNADVRFFNKNSDNTLTELAPAKTLRFLPYLNNAHQSEVLEYMNQFLDPKVMVEIIKALQPAPAASGPEQRSQAYAKEILKAKNFTDVSQAKQATEDNLFRLEGAQLTIKPHTGPVYPFIYKADYTQIQAGAIAAQNPTPQCKNLSNLDMVYKNDKDLVRLLENTKNELDDNALRLGIPLNAQIQVYSSLPIPYRNAAPLNSSASTDGFVMEEVQPVALSYILSTKEVNRYFFNEIEWDRDSFYKVLKATPELVGLAQEFSAIEERQRLMRKVKAAQATDTIDNNQPTHKI